MIVKKNEINESKERKLNFVDLFSGIGAFHETIKKVFPQSNCQYALDNDKNKNKVYQLLHNYPQEKILEGDVGDETLTSKLTNPNLEIDILCAGFPCQPYSRAGKQTASQHTLFSTFSKLLKVIETYNQNHQGKELKMLVLENVDNLITVEKGELWKQMKQQIQDLGYVFPTSFEYQRGEERCLKNDLILSPIDLGIPQNRSRLFLFSFHKDLLKKFNLQLPNPFPIVLPTKNKRWELGNWLNKHSEIHSPIKEEKEKVLRIWEELLTKIPLKDFPCPLWLDVFYPSVVKNKQPNHLIKFLQNIFNSLVDKIDNLDLVFTSVLSHTNNKDFEKLPWKRKFISENWLFYLKYHSVINKWWKKHFDLLSKLKTYRKLELCFRGKWDNQPFSMKNFVIQFRHSGIRIRHFNFLPTITKSYSPIFLFEKSINSFRYLTIEETFRLFGFRMDKLSPVMKEIKSEYLLSCLGDSINVFVLEYLFGSVFYPFIVNV